VTYEQDDLGYTDVHHVRQMTDEERAAKDKEIADEQAAYLESLNANPSPDVVA